ncbi:Retrovirus Polyprotein [Phytophthora palmivora]|uniref:Retrovirus Polyprotein n=1 Tax=Phytophthora palmivora TaxID=4796 RepID=A0A2P4Y0A2_9STRA|nr:Retrovirus Polyprotein [Phytophthora palmivora]
MPFGFTNAPVTFQRLMNGVRRGLNWMTCLVYLDDIVVFTEGNIERHVLQLAAVLERLSAAGLTLKQKNAQSMKFLGNLLSKEGVRPLNRLVTAVAGFPRPTDVVEIKRFVHLVGYHRKFIEAFTSIVESMTRFLKKGTVWQWIEEQESAFSRVKMMLTTRPLLLYPNFRLPFRLITDASKVGLGACLMQDQGRGWQPIAYASKANNDAEANYSITELECLAVVWSVKIVQALPVWLSFYDHYGPCCIEVEYEFDIQYAPGATNVVADALSRAPAAVRSATGRPGLHAVAVPTVKFTNAMSTADTTPGGSDALNNPTHPMDETLPIGDQLAYTTVLRTVKAVRMAASTKVAHAMPEYVSDDVMVLVARAGITGPSIDTGAQDTRTSEGSGNTITSSKREVTQDRSSTTAGSEAHLTAHALQTGIATRTTHKSTGTNSTRKQRTEPQIVSRKSAEVTGNKMNTKMSVSDQ